jgi:ferrous iron transport protein B
MGERLDTIMLVGNPNVGKSTLFNALTGGSAKVGNFPGITVDLKEGFTRTPHGRRIRIIDLPGCFSLDGGSPDQQIARRALDGEVLALGKPDLALCVLDASSLERHLPLAMEVLERGIPAIVVLNLVDRAQKSGIRLDPAKLSEELGVPVVAARADKGLGILELRQAIRHPLPHSSDCSWAAQGGASGGRQKFAMEICRTTARRPEAHSLTMSDRIDSVLLHPVFGWIAFLGIMLFVFWSIFSFSSVPMGWVESAQGWLAATVEAAMPAGDLRDLLVGGIIEGVGAVVIFLPQILMLFFMIGLFESSGYMARAAFLMDGFMARAGLSGKAFLPLLSSYACAIPGVMATRTIDSAKERLITIFVAPWMSCSARLPVYLLLVPMLLGGVEGAWTQSVVFFAIYALGTISAFVVARVLRGRLGPDEIDQPFALELPPYQFPQWGYIFRHLIERGGSFLKKAGTLILGLMILLWAARTYPKSDSNDPAEQMRHSLVGRVSQAIEPIVSPLGFDGRTGTAILTSFAAREVFVGSMAQLFEVDDTGDETLLRTSLREVMARQTWPDGRLLFTPLSVVSLLIFYIYALQCLPTSAVVLRESGSWKWAAGQLVFMSLFAALMSLIVYRVGLWLGF